MFGREKIEVKTARQIIAMRAAGLVVARTHEHLARHIREGVTTSELDTIAREFIVAQGAKPSFAEVPGYRHASCVSVGAGVVHGVPGERVLGAGDVVSIDLGAIVDGWHGDAAVTSIVGGEASVPSRVAALVQDTRDSLTAGIAAMRPGNRVGDIGAAVEDFLDHAGGRAGGRYGIVTEFEGHGIGRQMHMSPGVPNYAVRSRGPRLGEGVTLAIEPMVTLGTAETRTLRDDWTVVTADGSLASHEEHTVAITPDGIWVLTALDGGESLLGSVGAPFGPLGE